MNKKFKHPVVRILFLGLFLTYGGLASFVPSAQSQGLKCNEMSLEPAIQYGAKLTTLLKIANFRADVNYMGEIASELEQFLKTCGDETVGFLPLVCNYDCHLQLGRYYLFMSSDIPYLSNASGISRNTSPLSPQKLQEYGEKGLGILDRGLKLLGRQQTTDKTGEVSDDAFREFVRELTLLNGLKIRLNMALGDNWYQTVSEARLKRLSFLMADVTGGPGSSGVDRDPNLSRASSYYENAMWILLESKTDIPGESTYDDLRSDLLILENELKTRHTSLQQGLLYLNIDPEQFTSINFNELSHKVDRLKSELSGIENNVQGILERWHKNKEGEATRQIDENRVVRGQEVSLVAHRIGKLEATAKEYATKLRQDISKVEGEKDTWLYRQSLRQLEVELARKMAEYEQRKEQLMLKQENDLIVLSKEAELDKRNELRWLLSWEMSQMNLYLQLESLSSQITEYQRQKDRNTNRLQQMEVEEAQRQETLQINQLRIQNALETIVSYEKRKKEVYMDRRAVTREALCRIESELGFIGRPVTTPFAPITGEGACPVVTPLFTSLQYNQQMCGNNGANEGLRRKLLTQQIHARAFLLKCVLGPADFAGLEMFLEGDDVVGPTVGGSLPGGVSVDCGSFSVTETEFAKKIWAKEKKLVSMRKEDLNKQMEQLREQISFVKTWVRDFMIGVAAAEAGLVVLDTTLIALKAIPETWIFAAGMTTGVATSIKADKPLEATIKALREVINRTLQIGKIEIDAEQALKRLEFDVLKIEQALKNMDTDVTLRALSLHQAHFQLAGRAQGSKHELEELLLRNNVADFDCRVGTSDLEGRISSLNAEHRRLLATLNLEASQNQLIDFEIAAQNNLISKVQKENAILNLDLQRGNLQKNQLDKDNASIDQLVQSVQNRIDKVNTVKGKVEELANASNQVTNVIQELRNKQKDSLLALSNSELSFVERRLGQDQANTGEFIGILNEVMGLGLKNRELQDQILDFQRKTEATVLREQDRLVDLVSKIDDPNAKKNLFIATEEIISELMKGIPEYLNSKRQILETSNYLLHLMRKRYQITAGLTGQVENWPSTYVRNGTQLNNLVSDIEHQRFFNERQINIDVAEIVIPSTSGFARSLAKNEKVNFEISPDAHDVEEMAKLGYFVLWNKDKFSQNRNLTLVDMMIGVQYSCNGSQRNKFLLTHKGQGIVFKNIAPGNPEVAPQLVVGPMRSYIKPFYNLSSGVERVDGILNFWEDTFNVRNFPPVPGPPNDTHSILPFLGLPVIGTYEVELRPSSCSLNDAVFTLYVVFASAI